MIGGWRRVGRRVWAAAATVVLMACGTAGADEASHRAKAAEVFAVTGFEKIYAQQAQQAVLVLVKTQPGFGRYEDVLQQFVLRYLSWNEVQGDFVDLYVAAFTEPELDTLLAFYRTPAGQKSLHMAPRLATASGLILQRAMQRHSGELSQMIRAKDAQREQEANELLRSLGVPTVKSTGGGEP